MERIYIDREWCIIYVLLALDSIEHSSNKERTIEDFIKEIRVMFEVYTDESNMNKIRENMLKKYGMRKINIKNK